MAPKDDVTISIGIEIANVQKAIQTWGQVLHKGVEKTSDAAAARIVNLDKQLSNLQKQLAPKSTPFAGWAMSVMFFGMALQRMFDTIWKSSTKVFQDVMHSVEGTVTKFDILNGSTAYLGFVIGQALEPVVAWLIPIIDAISEWIEQNPQLTATFIILAGVIGTLAMTGGSLMLAYNGFKDLFAILGKPLGSSGIASLTLSSPLVLALAAIALSMGIFLKNINDNPLLKADFISKGLDPLNEAFNKLTGSTEGWRYVLDLVAGILFFIGGIAIYGVVNALTILINMLVIGIQMWTLLYKAMSGNITGVVSAALTIQDSMADIGNAYDNVYSNMKNSFAGLENGIGLEAQIGTRNANAPKAYSTMADAPMQQRTYNYYIQGYDLATALDIAKRDS